MLGNRKIFNENDFKMEMIMYNSKEKWKSHLSDFKLFLISQIILLLVIISFYINHNFF